MVKVYILLDLDWTWVNSRILNESKKRFLKILGQLEVLGLGLGFTTTVWTFLQVWSNKAGIFHETILGVSNRKESDPTKPVT